MSIEWNQAITIILFMVVHLCGTVWWMSKIQTTLTILAESVKSIALTVAAHESTYARKEDTIRDIAKMEKQLEAVWRRLDSPHACPNQCNKKGE